MRLWQCFGSRSVAVFAVAAAAGLGMARPAHAFIINFDDQGLTGPTMATQTAAAPVLVNTPQGQVSFSGGAILTKESNLLANQTSVYFTSFFLTGGLDTITITFPTSINNFFLNVYNGQLFPESFTVADNVGNAKTVMIAPNTAGGSSMVGFAAAGDVVTISTSDTTGFDFSIDNIGFDQPMPVPEPATLALLGVGLSGLGLLRRRAPRS